MARVYLSLGSNIEAYTYIAAALDELAESFGELIISSVFESEAVGFDGDNFLNLVVGIDTSLPVGSLSKQLKQIEDAHGRERSGPKYSGRTLDIDILTYDDKQGVIDGVVLPRDEVLKNAFVLWPLAEVAGDECHPQLGVSYQTLWQQYRVPQKLWKIDFEWRQKKISFAQ
ncbi:MAG: 2-amino-4-hydroxy-6-hydroxymethyldihydropteridine diphosphokinase [Cellvibrionaceae bacterium]|nr:2-amino-4-hydroxy-6-hydroxymethyldihydropteridine diphosphokinase [Cellvibrionaceae bacterium]|tara:strand:+ start:41597 stop:42109 length:513 start_codon:yes stop_codon:yes gene_type:complete